MSKKLFKSFGVGFLGQFAFSAVNIVGSIFMMRLIEPEVFGVMAFVNMFILFFFMYATLGMGVGLIQKKKISKKDTDTIFTLILVVSFVLFVALCIGSMFSEYIFGQDVGFYIRITSVAILFKGVSTIQEAILRKELKFSVVEMLRNITNLLSILIGLIIAYLGGGIYALIFRLILQHLLYCIFMFNFSRINFSLSFEFRLAKPYLKFGLAVLSTNTVKYIVSQIDNYLVGVHIGNVALGLYSRAYGLVIAPSNNFTAVFRSVLFPLLSNEITNYKQRFKAHTYLISLLLFVFLLVYIIVYKYSSFFVINILGENWIEIQNLLPYLVLIAFSIVFTSLERQLLLSIGKTRFDFWLNISFAILKISGITFGIYEGHLLSVVQYYSLSSLISVVLSILLTYYVEYKYYKV